MAATSAVEVYDLLILVDGTYSMSSYIQSLQTSLPKVIQISALTDCFARIGLLCYRDYCDQKLLEWSGWLSPSDRDSEVDLVGLARSLEPLGGGDYPEATKTGLARAYELMREDATTIVLLYTDAPPHSHSNGSLTDRSSNLGPEQTALREEGSYGGFGSEFADLVFAAKRLSKRVGEKKAQVFSILEANMRFSDAGYYNYLSTMSGGACIYLKNSNPATISKVTIELLLAWMGTEKAGTTGSGGDLPGYLTRYVAVDKIKTLQDEVDPNASLFFETPTADSAKLEAGTANITKTLLTQEVLKKYLPKKATPVQDFAKRYAVDEPYRRVAVEQLKKIIAEDVTAISLNPVFGSLWRAVCNDRDNEFRDEVITLFGLQVDRIKDEKEKSDMKVWLEESYDYTAEVLEAINSVPEDQRYPCVCLDPTLAFTRASHISNEEEDDKPITEFRRDELLEIGRSCDYRILRRLGRVLTRLTYINSAEGMPAHIAAAPLDQTPRIPMALASPEHKRKFWRILLHIVVPGTMLGARPAVLLAALSIRLGVQPLLVAADQEVMLWRNRWNNLEVPETWNTSCLTLLMDADLAYRRRRKEADDGETDVSNTWNLEPPRKRVCLGKDVLLTGSATKAKIEGLLKLTDRSLFKRLVNYKILEFNLNTSLTARLGWKPEKTSALIGPTVVCRSCEFPRSVTIMGANGVCGICLATDFTSPKERETFIDSHVTKQDNEKTLATWVECNLRACRAQYVVYHTENLNVKPKCHYCRNTGGKAPFLECTECLNRVIYPVSYRPKGMKDFKCYACVDGRKTVIDVITTAKQLCQENTTEWLLRNDEKIKEPFSNRSLFHTISTAGTDNFCEKVELFPKSAETKLNLDGKVVRNVPAIIAELQSWIDRRKTESGSCSLCFSSLRKSDFMLACGRRGCPQKICKNCLESWYGLNGRGRLINTAALCCPFCRRAPTTKTLAKFGMGIHAVGDLQTAVNEKGEWIFAWCNDCGKAKRYMERVCAAGAPVELNGWSCDECRNKDWNGNARVKKCPGCEIMTEKIGGCDHITCKCGTHWCFFCGHESTPSEIYTHMSKEHGGYYGGAEEDVTDEE